ncbi:MAG: Hsp20/alpha crystallin family protein [Anaerolineae bacterium]|nr:Hsp20/alpha crystallin family protein [Anaerolineae bacterium]
MTLNHLIPWKRSEKLPVRRQEADSFLQLRDEMDRMFESFFEPPWSLRPFEPFESNFSGFMPSLDVNETDKDINVTIELPGLEDKDIQLSLENNVLTVSGEKKFEKQEKKNNFHRLERSYGSFSRQVALPCDVDEDRVSAVFKNGILNISLPKLQANSSQNKRIVVKRG